MINNEDFREFLDSLDVKGLDFSTLSNFDEIENNRRLEWLKSRAGIFSASEASRLMTYEDKPDLPPGALTYIREKVLEIVTEYDFEKSGNRFFSKSVDHGSKTEVEAAIKLGEHLGREISMYGENQEFIMFGDHFGCTPDGLIYHNETSLVIIESGIETKCPDSKTHMEYVETIHDAKSLKEHMPKYYWQVQTQMYVTGANYWYFASYDPRFKNESKRLHCVRIDRMEDDINKFRKRLGKAIQKKNELLEFWK